MLSKKIILNIPPQGRINKELLPSIGVGYLAAVLEKNNYEVKIIDSSIAGFDNNQTADAILREKPFLVGVSTHTQNRFNAIDILQGVKKKSNGEIFTVAGGPHFSLCANQAIANIPSLDFVIRNEGEKTLLQLVNQLRKDSKIKPEKLKKIAGLTFRDGNKIIFSPDRDFIKNLDELPFPAWHLFDLDKYNARLEGIDKYRAIGVMSSRGCPSNCTFCVSSAFWRKIFRRHSPKKFVDEVESLFNKYGFRAFNFWDDTITIFRPHITEICHEILKRKLPIKWYAAARVNTVDFELLSLMKKAGCKAISFGVESGSEKILKIVQKGINLKQIRNIAQFCKELDFAAKFYFIYGLPGENEKDLNLTLNLIDELEAYSSKFHCYGNPAPRIYPGTYLEFLAKKEGRMPADFNWHDRGQPITPLYENKNFSLERVAEIVKQRRRERIRRKSLFSLIRKGATLLLRARSIKEIKSLVKKFIELRIKK